MVKEQNVQSRSRAVGMLEGGLTQENVSKLVGVNIRTVRRWWSCYRRGKSLENKRGRGRKSSIPKVAKLVIAKSTGKQHQSTRYLSRKLKSKGVVISPSTIYRYMKKDLRVMSYKRQRQPKLTERQKENRVKFCKERENWTTEDWKRIYFSDESPFELIHAPNRQNDRIWATKKSEVQPVELVKYSPKFQVWGMISYRAVSDLHIIPVGQTVTASYYVDSILNTTLMASLRRKRKAGSIIQKKMLPDTSKRIFQQDGAPAHTAQKSQKWCQENLPCFWGKGVWTGNSPDLSPIENVWAIVNAMLIQCLLQAI